MRKALPGLYLDDGRAEQLRCEGDNAKYWPLIAKEVMMVHESYCELDVLQLC